MKFMVTFGEKYRREAHPIGGHPDGWFEVEAEFEGEAREKTIAAMGDRWDFIYAETVFDERLFSRGQLGKL